MSRVMKVVMDETMLVGKLQTRINRIREQGSLAVLAIDASTGRTDALHFWRASARLKPSDPARHKNEP